MTYAVVPLKGNINELMFLNNFECWHFMFVFKRNINSDIHKGIKDKNT